ncbi:MAG: hypothetical protein ONB44_09660 [candidate division KSB1 bacterium]|nr:hypothetical protein [candidate division KSB1 bacterium]MDZ7302394.1 hypothetical protein [candidate division KSB1 bacterium]MDZ7311597.1 hypothetical protein [candidate division KSB1 bacterium]
MADRSPSSPHAFDETDSSFTITIPNLRMKHQLYFMGFGLVFFVMAAIFLLMLWDEEAGLASVNNLLLLLFLTALAAGGASILRALLWQLAGKEIITVTSSTITVRHQVLGLGTSKEYHAQHIKNLRLSPAAHDPQDWWFAATNFSAFEDGRICFDYGTKIVQLCSQIDEAEAKQIFAELQHRFPHYCQR